MWWSLLEGFLPVHLWKAFHRKSQTCTFVSNYLNLSRLITELAFQYNPEKKKQFSVEEPTDNKTEGGSSGEERDQEQG